MCAKGLKFHDPAKCNGDDWQTWRRMLSKTSKFKVEQTEWLGRYRETFRPPPGTN